MTCERCERPIREGASPCMLLFFDQNPPTHFFCSLGCIDMWMMVMPGVPKVSVLEDVKGKVFV